MKSLDIGPGPIPAKGTTHALDQPWWNDIEHLTPKWRRREWGDTAFERIKFRYGDVTKRLPYKDSTFDRVTCYNALGNEIDVFLAMPEIARVLKSTGHVTFVIYDTEEQDVTEAMRSSGLVITRKERIPEDETSIRIRGRKAR